MASTIWENEKSTFDAIRGKIDEKAEKEKSEGVGRGKHNNTTPMIQAGFLRRTSNEHNQPATIYRTSNPNGKDITFAENDKVAVIRYSYESKKQNNARDVLEIIYDKTTNEFAYYVRGPRSKDHLLALVSESEAYFPYECTDPNIIGYGTKNLPATEQAPTIRENIEKTLLAHPDLRGLAHEILSGFDEMLSFDENRQAKPISEEEILMAEQQERIEMLTEELRGAKTQVTQLEEENAQMQEDKRALEGKIVDLREENRAQSEEIRRLQERAERALEFIDKIKGSFLGKLLFGKQVDQFRQSLPAAPNVGGRKEDAKRESFRETILFSGNIEHSISSEKEGSESTRTNEEKTV